MIVSDSKYDVTRMIMYKLFKWKCCKLTPVSAALLK